MATASIKQATAPLAEPGPANAAEALEDGVNLPEGHVRLRSIPARVFRRWPDLRERCAEDERVVGWTSRRTLGVLRRGFEATRPVGKGKVMGTEEVPVEVFRVVGGDGDGERREVKRVKVVLRSWTGLSDGDVAIWPPVFADASAGKVGDWEKLG